MRPATIAPGGTSAVPHNVAWDPQSALGKIMKEDAGAARLFAIAKLVEETPLAKLADLMDMARSCPNRDLRKTIYDMVLARWTAADPTGALAYATASSVRDGDPALMSSVFAIWAGFDPRGALAAAEAVNSVTFRVAAMDAVLTAWAEGKDPSGAVAVALSLPPGTGNTDFLQLVFNHWTGLDPAAAFAALDQIDNRNTRQNVLNVLIGSWANSDPAQALAVLRSLPAGQQDPATYATLFLRWGAQNPAAAFAALQEVTAMTAHLAAVQSVFKSWAAADPVAALQAAQSLSLNVERDQAVAESLQAYITKDRQAAADYIAGMAPGESRNRLISALASVWANSDPAATLAWLNQNAEGTTHDQAVQKILNKMGQDHPGEALTYISQLPEGLPRDKYVLGTLTAWAKADGTAALDWVGNNLTGTLYDSAMSSLLRQMVDTNPAVTSTYINQLAASEGRDDLILQVATSLGKQDMAAAMAWAQNLPPDVSVSTQQMAMKNVVSTFAAKDPAAAAAYMQNLVADPKAGTAILGVVDAWAKQDSQAALAWAETLSIGALRDDAQAVAAAGFSRTDAGAAWNYAQKNLPAGTPSTNAAETEIAIYLSRKDMAAGAQAMMTIPAGNSRTFGTTNIAHNWALQDPIAAGQWVATLPVGVERDHAMMQSIPPQARSAPTEAYALALSASTDENRFMALRLALIGWGATDPTAATAALASAPVTQAQRSSLQRAITSAPQLEANRDAAAARAAQARGNALAK